MEAEYSFNLIYLLIYKFRGLTFSGGVSASADY